jgi:C1A family cysteine protease
MHEAMARRRSAPTEVEHMSKQFHLGWRPDQPDHRDLMYSAPVGTLSAIPSSVDLRPGCPPVYDQGHLGSCTANAIAGAVQFDRLKANQSPDFVPSRLFIYYNERVTEKSVSYDSGARLRDGIKTVHKQGVCPETDWPYSDAGAPTTEGGQFASNVPAGEDPPQEAHQAAKQHVLSSYQRLTQTLPQLQGCLAEGYPFVFGFSIYQNFFDANGVPLTTTPMPQGHQLGGHAVVAVGYDNATSLFTIRNSWGPGVLDKGYFYMPYAYVTEPTMASDFWTVRGMSD